MADKKKEDKKEKDKEEAKEEKAAPDKDAKKDSKDAPKEKEGAEGEAPKEGEEGAAPGKKKLPVKILIIAGAGGAVLLIGIIVAVLFMTGVLGGKPAPAAATAEGVPGKEAPAAAEGGHGKKEEGKKKEGSVFFDLGEMVVNLNTDGKRQTFLKLVVQLELESVEDKLVIENLKPRIVDNFQTYLRELRVDDLRGSAGLYRLREELLFRVTEAVHPIKIRDVLFQQMLVQ